MSFFDIDVDLMRKRQAEYKKMREIACEKARELYSQGLSLIQIQNHLVKEGFERDDLCYGKIEEWCDGVEVDPSLKRSVEATCETSQEDYCEQYERYKSARKKARELRSQGLSYAFLKCYFYETGAEFVCRPLWVRDVEVDPSLEKGGRSAQEVARELRSQGLSFDFIQAFLKDHKLKTDRFTPPSLSTLSAWCRGIKADRKLSQEKALEREKEAQEKARDLYSQGLSLSLIQEALYELHLCTAEGTIPSLETLSVWCRDVEVDTLSPSPSEMDTLSPSPSPSPSSDITAQEKARELRSQGLSLGLIQDRLKELGLKTSKGTLPTLKTLFVWCRGIEVKELKRKQSPHKGGRQRLEDMPQYEGLAPLIKRERGKGTSFNQIAALVAERGYKTAGEKAINKTQLIRIWKRISDD
jgi:hypothetical protein